MPVILALKKLRQEELEFEDSLGHIVTPCLKNTNKTKKKEKSVDLTIL
jgi:hypothetical protein